MLRNEATYSPSARFLSFFSTICLRSSTPRVVATSDEHLSRCGTHIHTFHLSTFLQVQNYCLTFIMLGMFVVEFNCLILYQMTYRGSVDSYIKLCHPLLNEPCRNVQNKYEVCSMLASTHTHIHDHQSRRTTRCFSRNTIQYFVNIVPSRCSLIRCKYHVKPCLLPVKKNGQMFFA